MAVFFAASLLGSVKKLPFNKYVYRNSIFSQNEILNAYLYLFEENDVHGILSFASWSATGGYYYLHKDIPIYSKDYFKPDDSESYLSHVSHILCPVYYGDIPGFETLVRWRKVEIRKQVNPPPEYRKAPDDTRNVLQKGIDDRFPPGLQIKRIFLPWGE